MVRYNGAEWTAAAAGAVYPRAGIAAWLTCMRTRCRVPPPPVTTQAASSPISTTAPASGIAAARTRSFSQDDTPGRVTAVLTISPPCSRARRRPPALVPADLQAVAADDQ